MTFRLSLDTAARFTAAKGAAATVREQACPAPATNGDTKYGVLASDDAAARIRRVLGAPQ